MAPAKPSGTVCQDSVLYLDILVQEILSNNPETKIQFYLTWGHPHGEAEECDEGMSQFCDYSAMQVRLCTHVHCTYNRFLLLRHADRPHRLLLRLLLHDGALRHGSGGRGFQIHS